MNKVLLAPVGDQPQALLPALKEFTIQKAHLLVHNQYEKQCKQVTDELDRFNIPYTTHQLSDNIWEDVFVHVGQIANASEHKKRIVVHVGIGDRVMQCAATAASFVNGLQAVNGNDKLVFGLPIMRFEYYSALNDRKKKILTTIKDSTKPMSVVADELNVSLSLLSYHVHGNRKSEGLVDMGLIEISEEDNQVELSLSSMGRLLLRGSVPQASLE